MKKILLSLIFIPSFSYAQPLCPDFPKDAIKYSQFVRAANEKNDVVASCNYGKKTIEALQGYRPCSKEAADGIARMMDAVKDVCKNSEAIQNSQEKLRKFSNDANCPGFLQARSKCATAGDYRRCMNILFPEFPYKYSDLEMLCPVTR
jgi:hypothetical protein